MPSRSEGWDRSRRCSDEVAERTARGIGRVREHFAALIASGIDSGTYRPDTAPEATADMLWALFLGLLQSNDARINLELPGASFTEAAIW